MATVLVVDDKEENRYFLRSLLGGLGHRVVAVSNGAEALEAARRDAPDLVIADILMPVMDGFTLCREWRADRHLRGIPFVFYTATYTEPQDEQLALSLGADRFIVKPMEPADFAAAITDLLAQYAGGTLRVAEARETPSEKQLMRQYNEVLVHKLEDKLAELEDANRALCAKDDFNQAVLNAVSALLAVVDAGGVVVAINEAWSRFARQPPPVELLRLGVGSNVLTLLGGEEGPAREVSRRLQRDTSRVLRGEQNSAQVELPYEGPDGQRRWFLVRVEPMAAPVAGAVLACIDITERKRAEDATRDMARRKDQFLALLGHELRNPLAPIKTASYLLRRSSLEPRAMRAAEIIDRQATHLGKLVDDLLDVSRIERGRLTIEREHTDWTAIVTSTAEAFRASIEARGIELRVETSATPLAVRGDPTRLAQILSNLLDNARKFSKAGDRIAVVLGRDDGAGRGTLTVTDSGIGMTAETLARLFRPFEQAEQSGARTLGGLGMGLALVKGLVELHGGEVRAASEGPGRGARITVSLPLAEPLPAARGADEETVRFHGERVLIIEDNPDAADSLSLALEMAGCRVRVAGDGRSGIELARGEHPEAIICDIGLPGDLDGYGVARLLRADPALASTKLVALTGYGQAEDQQRARRAGFDAHLAKPADVSTLLRLLADEHPR